MDGINYGSAASGQVFQEGQRKGISGSTIKIIAVTAMLLDHVGAVILERMFVARGFWNAMGSQNMADIAGWMLENGGLYFTYMVLRLIGRLGFPIFCFLLVEGFQRTRNVKKYALRLGMFALISEIPFNLALSGKLSAPGYQNVYFTLFLGLAVLCAFGYFGKFRGEENLPGEKILSGPAGILFMAGGVLLPAAYLLKLIYNMFLPESVPVMVLLYGVLCLGAAVCYYFYGRGKAPGSVRVLGADMTALVLAMFLADFLKTDYSGMGVLTIGAMYAFRKSRVKSMLAGCIVLTIMSVSEITAFFTLIPVAFYNGRRGLKMKYFFYAFYPAHLLLLYLTAVLLGLGKLGTLM